MFRRIVLPILMVSVLLMVGCTNKKVTNPIAQVDSKQPDKVLYDRAMDAMKHNKFDVARLSLQTLINTYPDSEYVARAKLAIGDSWYAEGGAAAMAQAESEYKDFETFFPNMPEAAEAQMKIANIHYNEMEKADRDYTHAKRAEEEYRQLIMQYPDSPMVPQAKQRLLQVQEVLAEREFVIGHFYYTRESWPAAIARLKSLTDTYPLYSGADEALYELGNAWEKEADLLRRSKLAEAAKGVLVKEYTQNAAAAYDRILTRYPEEDRADDARKRLQAMGKPIPKATPEAIAQNKKEQESRGSLSSYQKVMQNFKKGPDVAEAVKVGDPTMVDPKQASAPEMVRSATASMMSALAANNKAAVETINGSGPPPANAAVPRSDTAAGVEVLPTDGTVTTAPPAAPPIAPPSASDVGKSDGIPELQNDLPAPPTANTGAAPPPPPTQVNDAPAAVPADGSAAKDAGASQASAATTAADPSTESTSKKKKKHHFPF